METTDAVFGALVDAINAVGSKYGVKLDANQVKAYAEFMVDAISGSAWRAAQVKGQAAADKITTAGEAEQAARDRR
jgi:hypothetical protein